MTGALRAALGLVSLLAVSNASAGTTTLKQVQVNNGSQVDLLFDGKIGKNQVRTEFFNDVIQIILSDAAVYPAKISSVQGGDLTKIFAYQYAPKLVRCRLTVKGKAESYKDKIQVTTQGRILSVRLNGAETTDRITTASAQAQRVGAAPAAERGKADRDTAEAKAEDTSEERALFERITRADKADKAEKSEAAAERAAEKQQDKAADKASEKQSDKQADKSSDKPKTVQLASGKPVPSMLGTFGKLFAVLALFLGLAFAAKRLLSKVGGKQNSQLIGAISKFAGVARKPKMIEVLSNHHLGPKKSICVVKIAGRTMVLGVTNESINLISQLSGDLTEAEVVGELGAELGDLFAPQAPAPKAAPAPAPQPSRAQQAAALAAAAAHVRQPMAPQPQAPQQFAGMGAQAAGPAVFSDILGTERSKPALPNVRSQIKSKLEGYKPL